MLKYILFDFDGTLVDTNELIIKALNETSKRYLSKELSEDELNAILGKYLEEQMKCLSEEHCTEMVEFYREYYNEYQFSMIQEFPGIGQMLSNLIKQGCKIAIVSAKGRGGIERALEHLKLREYIDVIVSAYDVEKQKPDPECVIKALEAFGGSLSESLVVGDSPYDILCGKNAGIKTALVNWSIFPRDEILKLNPDFIINDPNDLIRISTSD